MLKDFSTSILFFISLYFLIQLINFPKNKRYYQKFNPLIALFISIIAIYCYWFSSNKFLFFINNLKNLLQFYIDPSFNYQKYIEILPFKPFPLYFNLLILIIFFIIKTIFHISIFIYEKFSERPIKKSFAYIYDDKEKKKIYLAQKYVFLSKFMNFIALYALLNVFYCIYLAYFDEISRPTNYPALPVIPMIIFFELAWYLGGSPHLEKITEDIDKTGEKKKKIFLERSQKQFKELWAEYNKIDVWEKNWCLVKNKMQKIQNSSLFNEYPLIIDIDIRKELELVIKNIEKNCNLKIDNKELQILTSLWKHEDILLSCSIYERFTPLLFAALQRDVLVQQKILVLTNKTPNDEIESWIRKWTKVALYYQSNIKISNINNFKRNEDIIISSIEELINYNFDDAIYWFNNLKTIVITEVSEVIFQNILIASALFQILSDKAKSKIQIIILSTERRKNLKSSIQECLYVNLKEFYLPYYSSNIKDDFYMIWSTEGKKDKYFQDAVLKNCSNFIIPEIIMSVPALENQVETIKLIGSEHNPWFDSIEKLDIFFNKSKYNAKNIINYYRHPNIITQTDTSFGIAYDKCFNIISTLQKVLAFGKESNFVHVISPPYILRDYLADNIIFFQDRLPEIVASLSPSLMLDSSTTAFCLKQRLLNSRIYEDEITRHINRIKYDISIEEKQEISKDEGLVEERLIRLFEKIFNKSNYIEQIDYYIDDVFVNSRFEKKLSLKLRPELNDDFKDDIKTIKDPSGRLIHKDHIEQKYIPGQVHSFNGQLHFIKSIDYESKVINTEPTFPDSLAFYRYIKVVKFKSKKLYKETTYEKICKNNLILSKSLFEANMEIETTGYYTFNKGINFRSGAYFIKIDPNIIEKRKYTHGRMLIIEIKEDKESKPSLLKPMDETSKDKPQGTNKNKTLDITNTLVLLLNEIFPTIFPESYHYILAVNNDEQSNTSFNEHNYKPKNLIPKLDIKTQKDIQNNESTKEENKISISIIEDSKNDMGLVKAIYDNIGYVLQIIEDYLAWYEEKENKKEKETKINNSFLKFGFDKLPEWIDITNTKIILQNIFEDELTTIRKDRLRFKGIESDENMILLKKCNSCKKEKYDYEILEFKSNNIKCHNCILKSVNTQEELDYHFEAIKESMINNYNFDVFDNLKIEFAKEQKVKKVHNKTKSNFKNKDLRNRISYNKRNTIYIVPDKQYHLVVLSILFEITNIWQKTMLDYKSLYKENSIYFDGFALFIGYRYLINDKLFKNDKFIQKLTEEKLFIELYDILKQENMTGKFEENPFDFMEEKFGIYRESNKKTKESILIILKKLSRIFRKKEIKSSSVDNDNVTKSENDKNNENNKIEKSDSKDLIVKEKNEIFVD